VDENQRGEGVVHGGSVLDGETVEEGEEVALGCGEGVRAGEENAGRANRWRGKERKRRARRRCSTTTG
jgi:hypothetical protein